MIHSTRLATLAMVLASCTMAAAQASDAWPTKTVRIIVGYPAGSSPDNVARLIAPALGQALGQTVVIENKAGAGGNLGIDAVIKANDGHTLGITTNGPLTTSKQLYSKLPFDPEKDIQPLTLAATSPLVLVTSTKVPAKTSKEFIDWAKAQPGGANYGSIGVGSGSHLTMALFATQAGLKMVHVPYQGFAQVTQAIIAHDVNSGFMAPSGAMAQAKAGKVNVLGVSSARRSPLFPDVPTVAEGMGSAKFDTELWIAAFGPAGMPADVATKLTQAINAALQTSEVRTKLAEQGWEARGESGAPFAKRVADDTALWGQVIKQANVPVQ